MLKNAKNQYEHHYHYTAAAAHRQCRLIVNMQQQKQ